MAQVISNSAVSPPVTRDFATELASAPGHAALVFSRSRNSNTAEVLSGLTIAQAVRPGAPVIFGGAPASFHMQLMTNPMTAVEALQVYCGYAQVAKHLKLPCQAYMALSDSKFNDPQAGMETGVGAFLAASAGINSISGPGMLDYVNCFSLEKLVFDDEVVAHAKRFVRPVEVKDDLPAAELLATSTCSPPSTRSHAGRRSSTCPGRWSTAPTGTSGPRPARTTGAAAPTR